MGRTCKTKWLRLFCGVHRTKNPLSLGIVECQAREIQNKRNVYFYFSRDEVRKAIDENFELCNKGIKCNINIEELKEKHLGWLPVDLAVVFSNTKISF